MHGQKLHCFNFENAFIPVYNSMKWIATGACVWILLQDDFSPQKCLLLLVDAKCRLFQQNWTAKYLHTEVGGLPRAKRRI